MQRVNILKKLLYFMLCLLLFLTTCGDNTESKDATSTEGSKMKTYTIDEGSKIKT